MPRLFIGIDLPAELKDRIGALIDRERQGARVRDIRWTAAVKLHLTLKFLGETPEAQIPAVLESLKAAAASARAAPLQIRGVGLFPDERRPRVLWLDVRDGDGWLARLAASLEAALEPLGFAREQRPYAAHLTLARFEDRLPAGFLASMLGRLGGLELGEFLPAELVLFESRPTPYRDYVSRGAAALRLSQRASDSSGRDPD